jgi:hypothetical protein
VLIKRKAVKGTIWEILIEKKLNEGNNEPVTPQFNPDQERKTPSK